MRKAFLLVMLLVSFFTSLYLPKNVKAVFIAEDVDICKEEPPSEGIEGTGEIWCGYCTGKYSESLYDGEMQVYSYNEKGVWGLLYSRRHPACAPPRNVALGAGNRCTNIVVEGYTPVNFTMNHSGTSERIIGYTNNVYQRSPRVRISVEFPSARTGDEFEISIDEGGLINLGQITGTNKKLSTEFSTTNTNYADPEHSPQTIHIKRKGTNDVEDYCSATYNVEPVYENNQLSELEPQNAFDQCSLVIDSVGNSTNKLTSKDRISITGRGIPHEIIWYFPDKNLSSPGITGYKLGYLSKETGNTNYLETEEHGTSEFSVNKPSSGNIGDFTVTSAQTFPEGEYTIYLYYGTYTKSGLFSALDIEYINKACSKNITISDKGGSQEEETKTNESAPPPDIENVCESIPQTLPDGRPNGAYYSCKSCLTATDVYFAGEKYSKTFDLPGSYTALGCIPTNLEEFLSQYLFTIGLGFAGGIAFLLMLWGGFNILISQGDAHKIQMGREIIVSAGVGLLFIIFAIVILQFIGKEIGIPGFG